MMHLDQMRIVRVHDLNYVSSLSSYLLSRFVPFSHLIFLHSNNERFKCFGSEQELIRQDKSD